MNCFEIQTNRGSGWTTERLGLPSFDTLDEAVSKVTEIHKREVEMRDQHKIPLSDYRIVAHDGRSAGWVVKTILAKTTPEFEVERLRDALVEIRELADGRRHYRDAEGGEGCFTALGEIRDLADKALS